MYWLLACTFLIFSIVAICAFVKRGAKIDDPRTIFTLIYTASSLSPIFFFLVSGYKYRGLVEDRIGSVVIACFLSLLGFLAGAAFCDFRLKKWLPDIAKKEIKAQDLAALWRRKRLHLYATSAMLCFFALLLAILSSVALRATLSKNVSTKSDLLFYADQSWVKLYTISNLICLASFIFLSCAFASARCFLSRSERALNHSLNAAYVFLCLANGERDFILLIIAYFLSAGASVKFTRRYLLYGALIISAIIAIPIMRSGAPTVGAADSAAVNPVLIVLFTNVSPNSWILSQVIDGVDRGGIDLRFGGTYLYSALSIIPGMVDKSLALPNWFKDYYSPNATVGYGFALDAEAYLNFGMVGPPIFFFVLGACMEFLYKRRLARNDAASIFIYAFTMIIALFSIRDSSQSLVKSLIFGVLLSFAMNTISSVSEGIKMRKKI